MRLFSKSISSIGTRIADEFMAKKQMCSKSMSTSTGGVVMIGWLLKNLIQEVPEELAICEFDCPNNECAVRDWAKCELRHQTSLYGSGINLYNTRMVHIKAPVLKTPGFEKAELLKPLSSF